MRSSICRIGLVALASVSLTGTVNAGSSEAVTTGSINILPNVAAECRADAARLCGAIQPGNGRLILCLSENRTRVSRTCSAFLSRAEQSLRR